MIIKLDESALRAAGFTPALVETMRHIVRQLGMKTHETTLPQLASMTDGLTPIVNGLTVTVTATNATVSEVIADASEHRYSDAHLVRRLDEMQAALDQSHAERSAIARALSEIRDEISQDHQVQPTIASLGAAALAGSSTQAFSTAALTPSGLVNISAAGAGQIKFPATQNASADVNTLDDYEEGTWTATFTTSGTQPTTAVTRTVRYTKIGRVVTVHVVFGDFTVSGATGNISVAGLPFASTYPATGAVWCWGMGATPMVARIDTGATAIQLATQIDNNAIPVTNAANQYLYFTVTYLA